jgi:hypothetical protein
MIGPVGFIAAPKNLFCNSFVLARKGKFLQNYGMSRGKMTYKWTTVLQQALIFGEGNSVYDYAKRLKADILPVNLNTHSIVLAGVF